MRVVYATLFALTSPAVADVRSLTDIGFATEHKVVVRASPTRVFTALGQPGRWWSSDHTYSGNARNMTMVVHPGGCFCERIPKNGGMVEHGRVVSFIPDQSLRLSAALGPLQAEGAVGSLTWTLSPAPDGGTTITQSFVTGGYMRQGPRALAPAVDGVMAIQLARLAAYVDPTQ